MLRRQAISLALLSLLTLNLLPKVPGYNPSAIERTALAIPPPRMNKAPPREVMSLAKNIYFEARGEPEKGQIAVAYVTLNRIGTAKGRDSVTEVVYQRHNGVCQFSWVCDKPKPILDKRAWDKAMAIAVQVLRHEQSNPIGSAIYYHRVTPTTKRNPHAQTVRIIGEHTFYRLASD